MDKNKKRRVFLFILLLIMSFTLVSLRGNWFWRLIYPLEYDDIIVSNARKYGLDPSLVAGIIYVESKFIPDARSHRGALGLMQIMPETGKWIADRLSLTGFTEDKLLDPEINIMCGCWYLADLKRQFEEMIIVLAAYNAGRGNVKKWLDNKHWDGRLASIDVLPFEETRKYLKSVVKISEKYRKIYYYD